MMMEEEAPSGGTEGAVAAVESANVGTVGVGAVGGVGDDNGGGASVEGAPSVMDEVPPPALPQVAVNGGDDGAVQQQQEEPPLSPVRRTNVNQIDPTKIPSDSIIFALSQTLLLDSKNGQKCSTVDFLMPPNKQHHRQAPPHFVGWDEDDFDWRDVVLALYVWNRLMTLEQRQRELKKSQKLGPPGREKYKRKIKQLHEDRPTTVADITDPNANNSTALVPARRSTRTVQNAARAAEAVDAQALAELVERAEEYSSDPGRQERARQRATGQVGQRGGRVTPPSDPTPVDAVEIVGMGSTEEERSERVQQRVSNRNKWKRRRQGTNCTSLGMQGDAQALTMVNSFHETAGKTVETLHFPQLSEGQPSHAVMSVSYNEFDVYNSGGGRTVNSGRRAEKPRLTITADNRASVCSLVRQLAGALSRTRDKEATSGTYELDDVILECNFKDTASPLHEAVRRRNDTFRGEHLSRPSTNRESNDQIQRRIPSSITAGADMSPGVRDRHRMDDANEDE